MCLSKRAIIGARRRQARYSRSAKGRATQRRYERSVKGKAVHRRYERTQKGRKAIRRYRSKPATKEHRAWLQRSYRTLQAIRSKTF